MIARVYQYGDSYKVVWFKYGMRSQVLTPGCENVNDEKLSNNISRARGRILELSLCNPWEYFCTLTLSDQNGDRYDLDRYHKDLGNWIGNFNRKYHCKLRYLIIPEQHKDGAWHMHGLLHDVPEGALIRNQYGYLDMPYYQQRFGWISIAPIQSIERIGRYITKYVQKDVGATDIDVGKHLFYASHGLAGKVVLGEMGEYVPPEGAYENDYTISTWVTDTVEIAKINALIE